MFKKILIANRGEIAVRVIRACRELGLKTVAVHSDADRESLHVKLADESICIGPAAAAESYLKIPNIISAAEISGADAIHPGYGFLSENTHFADVCESCHIHFIGPSKRAIENMGNKAAARETMKKAGVPIIPGSDGPISLDDPNELKKIAKRIGYPVICKASAGGGGKGMKVIPSEESLIPMIQLAQSEAKAAFGNGDVYLEKYLEEPRHIEFQIAGDSKGKVAFLPERDCSIQRRHQKLVEESPSPIISASLRKKMGKAAIRAAESVDYVTVGTVEFLVDKHGDFYFLEMNTRIQVEHTVTEMVTGMDLVKEQIKLAAGEKLHYNEKDYPLNGHSIEVRVNAEDPDHDFRPSPGQIKQLILPGGPGVRVDTHMYSGYSIPTYYDSLVAKLVVHGEDRTEAIARLKRAIRDFRIEGIKTTLPLFERILDHQVFKDGKACTDFVPRYLFGSGNGAH